MFIYIVVSEVPLNDLIMHSSVANYGNKQVLNWIKLRDKIKHGGEVSIITFGGSVSYGCCEKGNIAYSTWFVKYLNESYPSTKFKSLNYAIGGTHPFYARCSLSRSSTLADIYILVLEQVIRGHMKVL